MSKFLYLSLVILSGTIVSCNSNKVDDMQFVREQISCSAENPTIDTTAFLVEKKLCNSIFGNGQNLSPEQAKTGKYSLKTDKFKPFGFTYEIPNIAENDSFEVSVWRYSPDKIGNLVVSSEKSDVFYASQSTGTESDNYGWELLKMNVVIPKAAVGMKLKIYVWNPDTVKVAYFDDLTIKYLNKK